MNGALGELWGRGFEGGNNNVGEVVVQKDYSMFVSACLFYFFNNQIHLNDITAWPRHLHWNKLMEVYHLC